jgi:hypothetical protein
VPEASVIRELQALSGFTGCKASAGVSQGFLLNLQRLTLKLQKKPVGLRVLEADGTVSVGVKSVDIDRNTKSEGIQLGQP